MRWREYFLPKSKSIPFILLSLCFQQTSTTTHFAVSNYYLTPVRPSNLSPPLFKMILFMLFWTETNCFFTYLFSFLFAIATLTLYLKPYKNYKACNMHEPLLHCAESLHPLPSETRQSYWQYQWAKTPDPLAKSVQPGCMLHESLAGWMTCVSR